MGKFWAVTIEVTFIMFLLYANLLMGEFERSGSGRSKGIVWALANIFTVENFIIGVIAATVFHVLLESIRKGRGAGNPRDETA